LYSNPQSPEIEHLLFWTLEFDAVEFMRERRTKIAGETEGMSFTELKKYFGQIKVKPTQIIPRPAGAG